MNSEFGIDADALAEVTGGWAEFRIQNSEFRISASLPDDLATDDGGRRPSLEPHSRKRSVVCP